MGSSSFLNLFANEDSDLVSSHDHSIVGDDDRNNQPKPFFPLSENARVASYEFGWCGRKRVISS